jgi:hypothetical protein
VSIKSLTHRVTAKAGRQVLKAQKHSPVFLVGLGIVGVGASVVMACRATLKLSDVLAEGEEHLKKVEVTVTDGEDSETKKASFNVRLQTAIKIARLYAPTAILFTASVGALAGSHLILSRRNAGLAAAYIGLDGAFKDYRGRVITELGEEKDFEFLHGVHEREIVEEGPNGPEVKIIRGLDQKAMQEMDPETTYGRVFSPLLPDGSPNSNWQDVPGQNNFFLEMVQNRLNSLLRLQGYVFLNDAYDLLGYKKTKAGQVVGWVKNPEDGKGDGYIDFGVWRNGVHAGKEWINGHKDAYWLSFNVDGPILDLLDDPARV